MSRAPQPPHPPPPGYAWQPTYVPRAVAHTAWPLGSIVAAFVLPAFALAAGSPEGVFVAVLVVPAMWLVRVQSARRTPEVHWQLVPAGAAPRSPGQLLPPAG